MFFVPKLKEMAMKAILEIRAGEGGDDPKLFLSDMLRMYRKYCSQKGIGFEELSSSISDVIVKISGDLGPLLSWEPGVHRLQRVPPTEHNGRRHSSTLTVAVLPLSEGGFTIRESDLEIETCKGTGPGGQHRNKTETAVRVKHRPTGLMVFSCNGRSQYHNRVTALEILGARLQAGALESAKAKEDHTRRVQIGMAGRAEKIRTYNFIENRVMDERVAKALYCLDKVMDGELDRIYDRIKA